MIHNNIQLYYKQRYYNRMCCTLKTHCFSLNSSVGHRAYSFSMLQYSYLYKMQIKMGIGNLFANLHKTFSTL